tara:strand:+ start:45903 stop:46868 length:966 start_codon:yes stop_codon:yes gene_type:complete
LNKDLVSIIIPTYNRINIIQETISSAINQTYKRKEIIVLDNNSSDNTYEILKKKYSKIKFFKLYKNNETIDIVLNWKKCVEFAKGKYIHILWSDDLIEPTFIEESVSMLNSNSHIGFVYSKTIIFNNNKNNRTVFDLGRTGIYDSSFFIKKSLLDDPLSAPVSPANAVFRKKDIKKNLLIEIPNNYNIDFSKIGQGNDVLIFLLTLLEYDYFGYINKPLAKFRAHNESITLSTNSFMVNIRYHIAKAFFLTKYKFDNNLVIKFNSKAMLLFILNKIFNRKSNYSYENMHNKNITKKYSLIHLFSSLIRYLIYFFKRKINFK